MIRGKKLSAIIPARSGSKGIPGKNLLKIDGETLIERTINKAKQSSYVDEIWVTTDDPEMYRIAKKLGAAPPNLRPQHLATGDAKTIDAVNHVLTDTNTHSGYIVLLQVTSPLWTIEDLNDLCSDFENKNDANAIVSVVKHDAPHPEKIMEISDGLLQTYLGGATGTPRQQLPDVYALNGAFYLLSLANLKKNRSFIPEGSIPYIMPPERSVNLDNFLDLALLKGLLGDKVES